MRREVADLCRKATDGIVAGDLAPAGVISAQEVDAGTADLHTPQHQVLALDQHTPEVVLASVEAAGDET